MKKVIVFGLSVMFLLSCNNATEKATTNLEKDDHATHQADDTSTAPELNNGEKWVVNQEMKPFVSKGEELVNAFVKNGQPDHKTLVQQLKDQNSALIKSCTMDGKSHDELHKWLHPHLELVKALENEADAAKANEIVLQLQESYRQYHQYFN